MKKKDFKYIIIFIAIIILISLFFIFSDKLFGSKTDWLGQHVSFAEYFRNLFYETKQIFPNFAFNIGGGQNIYNFSYYGLFDPIIFISYFLPFIKMIDYIMISSLINTLFGTILIYYFLKPKVNEKLAFIGGLLFLFSGPIIFHAHRHLMFVSYMPFLILGLIGVDKYFNKNKPLQLIISIFLMILTSYYYSIGGIVVLVIYGIYKWLKQNKFNIKSFIKDGMIFLIPIIIGILLASFLLLPTAYSMLNGRGDSPIKINYLDLFIPNFDMNNLLYSNYSIGLTSIFIIAIFYFIINKKNYNKYLGIIFLLFSFIPLFIYILNGTLYVRTKVLIPFLPLAILMITIFLKDLFKKNIDYKKLIFIIIIFTFLALITKLNYILLIDILITIISIILYKKYKKEWLVIVPLLIIVITMFISYDMKEGYVKKSYNDTTVESLLKETKGYNRTTIDTNNLYNVNKIYNKNHYSNSMYSSIYNDEYHKFYTETFDNPFSYRNNLILASSDNLLFQTLMGSKYLISSKHNLNGYKSIKEKDDLVLYSNEAAFSLGYGTSNLMSEEDFKNLKYPYNIESLFSNIIVGEKSNNIYTSNINKIQLNGLFNKPLDNQKINDIHNIKINETTNFVYKIEEPIKDKILLIDFEVIEEPLCKDGDISISINNITNKLTCKTWQYKNKNNTFTYVINDKNIDKLNIKFTKGNYVIKNINTYTLDYSKLTQNNDNFNFMNIKKIKGDIIEGSIDMKEDGYGILSIPYDKGFKVYVDNKLTNYEKVNTAFIGFKIEEGVHEIKIIYNAPYSDIGKFISLFALIILGIYIFKIK